MDQDGICRAIDALENMTTALVNMQQLPDRLHVEALRELLPGIVATLKKCADYDAFVGIDANGEWSRRELHAMRHDLALAPLAAETETED